MSRFKWKITIYFSRKGTNKIELEYGKKDKQQNVPDMDRILQQWLQEKKTFLQKTETQESSCVVATSQLLSSKCHFFCSVNSDLQNIDIKNRLLKIATRWCFFLAWSLNEWRHCAYYIFLKATCSKQPLSKKRFTTD